MSIEKARAYLKSQGFEDRIMEFDVSSATVDLAALALNCEPDRIAKTMAFLVGEEPILIVTSGKAKIANNKYKHLFNVKAKMISPEMLNELIGHNMGGVCPFGINDNVKVYLDVSLRKYDIVYPAAGSDNSAVKLSIDELEQLSNALSWIDVCKDPEIITEC